MFDPSLKVAKISVCIPFYKGARTVERSVVSIISQLHESTENGLTRDDVDIVITSDDNSPQALDVFKRLEDNFGVRIILNEQRQGLTGNWSAALSQAKGEIATLLHQDDWYNPNSLKCVVELFDENPNLVMAGFDSLMFPNDPSRIKRHSSVKKEMAFESMDYSGRDFFAFLLTGLRVPPPSTVFFRREKFQALDELYNSDFGWCPEYDLYLRLTKKWPSDIFRLDDRPIVSREISSDQFSANNDNLLINDYLTIWKRYVASGETQVIDDIAGRLGERISGHIFRLINRMHIARPADIKRNLNWLNEAIINQTTQDLFSSNYRARKAFVSNVGEISKRNPFKPVCEWVANSLRQATKLPTHMAGDVRSTAEEALAGANYKEISSRRNRVRNSEFFQQPLIICGFHHSGTRLLAELLDQMGVFQKVNSPTHEWSYFQWVNSGLLPEWNNLSDIESFDVEKGGLSIDVDWLAFRMANVGYTGHGSWGQKDPRNSITVGAWLKAFPKARVINILRDPRDVLGTFPANYTQFGPNHEVPQEIPEFWADCWRAYLEKTRESMAQAESAIEVTFEDLCRNPIDTLNSINESLNLGCTVNEHEVRNFGIRSDKIGIHKTWLKEGKVSPQAIEVIKNALRESVSGIYDL